MGKASIIGASNRTDSEREKDDFYATHMDAARMLADIEELSSRIWEPACGKGHISEPLKQLGFDVMSTDLVNRGYGEGGIDFLGTDELFEGDIVTNPPYKLAVPFIRKALSTVAYGHKVCMFLKVQFLEGEGHRKLFDQYPPSRVWVSSRRIPCAKDGDFSKANSMIAYAWFVWFKGIKGPTELRWFNSAKDRKESFK